MGWTADPRQSSTPSMHEAVLVAISAREQPSHKDAKPTTAATAAAAELLFIPAIVQLTTNM